MIVSITPKPDFFKFDRYCFSNLMIDIDLLLTWGGTYRNLEPEEILFMEGSSCSFYYQLVSGGLRWVNINEEGKEYLQTLIEPGQSVGELPLFDDKPYAATAISNMKSTVIRLHKSDFHNLLAEYPPIHLNFSRLLADRLRFKFFLTKEMAGCHPEKLILDLLIYFAVNGLHVCPKDRHVKLTRQQIANFTGLRVETVIRAIRHLSETGTLKIEKGKVFFKNMTPVITEN